VDSYSDTEVTGSIDAAEDGLMYTSIAYESGWTVYVDGVKAETVKLKDAMLAVPLTAGHHTIRMTYTPEGFHTGILLTVLSVVLLILLTVLRSLLKRHTTSSPFIEDYYPEDEDDVDEEDRAASEDEALLYDEDASEGHHAVSEEASE
jgi:hypothetical protein